MSEEFMNNSNENTAEQASEKNKEGLFSKLGQKAQSAIKWGGEQLKKGGETIIDSIKESKEKLAEKKALDLAFEKEGKKFYIIYKDKTKKNQEVLCIIDEKNKIIRTDSDIVLPNEVQCIQDTRKQDFYIILVKTEKYPFIITYNNKELTKELFQIEYTNDKPKQEVYNTYNVVDNRVDNSIKASKGSIVGDNSSIKKDMDINLGLNIPKE